MKKIITLLALVLFFAACSSDDDKQDILPQIVVNTDEVHLIIGGTYQLDVKVIGKGNLMQTPKFTYKDQSIASANTDYLITALNAGETTITIEVFDLTKDIKVIVEDKYTLEEFYKRFCYGYKVKDTTDLQVIHPQTKFGDNITYLFAKKGDKFWIGEFNPHSYEQIKEYITNKPFSLQKKIYSGYGKYLDFTIKDIKLIDLFETKNGWVSELNIGGQNWETHGYSLLLFNEANDTKEYVFNDPVNWIEKWYEDSFIRQSIYNEDYEPQGPYTIFKSNGDIIISGSVPHENRFPVDYDKYISFSHAHTQLDDDEITYLSIEIEIASLSNTDNPVKKTFIYNRLSKEINSILTYEVMDVANNIYTIRVDITYYSGDKVTNFYDVDARNDLIKQKDVIIL